MLFESCFPIPYSTSVFCFILAFGEVHAGGVSSVEPSFDVPIVNVTVVAGQNIVLHCSIDRIGKYKVVWLDPNSFPLTYEDKRVIDDVRFSILRSTIKEWNLYIRNVRRKDDGTYRCTLNTDPVRSKMVILHVKVPPQIIVDISSHDVTVNEGETVVLRCNVTGVPQPEVTWFRRPGNANTWPYAPERLGSSGEVIVIQNVSRYCGDIYECVANNGVPPSVSRQIHVTVQFAPEIRLHNRRIGQKRGRDAVLECFITSLPLSSYHWERGSQRIVSGGRRTVDVYEDLPNTITLRLTIEGVTEADFGEYTCRAENQLGREHESVVIYEYVEAVEHQQSHQHHLNSHNNHHHHQQQQRHYHQRRPSTAATLNNYDSEVYDDVITEFPVPYFLTSGRRPETIDVRQTDRLSKKTASVNHGWREKPFSYNSIVTTAILITAFASSIRFNDH